MSDLMVDFIMSLDGYGAAEGWPGFWGMEGPEYLAWIGDDEVEEHVALMGATTYRLMSGFAAADARRPRHGRTDRAAQGGVLLHPGGATVLGQLRAGRPVTPSTAVREMKAEDSRPLRTIGSLSLCRSLLAAGLVDRFRVVVFPVITGATGRDRIFDAYPDVALDLVDNRTFDGRLQLLEYVPTVLDGPPGRMTEEILDLGDVRLCIERFGDPGDPTILLISGAAESMDGWDPAWCEQLAAAGRRVVRYDHRDSGRSTSSPPGHPSYPGSALTGDVLRILDALDVDRAHLVGLSMGGGIAQEVAARHPERVATLTLVATSPAGRRQDESPLPPPEPRVAETFGNPPPEPDWTDREAVVDHLVESYRPYAGSLGFDEPAARRLVEHVVDRTVDIEAASKNHWLVAGDDEDDGFAMTDIVAPTLVIHGTTDPMFPLAHGEALAREIGDATLLRVPGMGHERPPVAVRAQATEAILRHTRPRPLDDDHGGEHQQPAQQLPG